MGNGGSERLGMCLEIRASVSEPCCSQPQALLLCQWLNADLSQASLFLLPGAWVSEKNSPKDARGDCSKKLKPSRKQLPPRAHQGELQGHLSYSGALAACLPRNCSFPLGPTNPGVDDKVGSPRCQCRAGGAGKLGPFLQLKLTARRTNLLLHT